MSVVKKYSFSNNVIKTDRTKDFNIKKINALSSNGNNLIDESNFNQEMYASRETDNVKYDSSDSGKKVRLPYADWIFGPENLARNKFGGSQCSLNAKSDEYLKDPKIWEIVNNYYPDADIEDLELLFFRMNSVGCGFIAGINTILFEFGYFQREHSADLFYQKFGYALIGLDGTANFNYMFLDFFLFYAKEFKGYKSIEDVYGNVIDEKAFNKSGDAALLHDKFEFIGIDGSYIDDIGIVLVKYLEENGVEGLKVYPDGIKMSKVDRDKKIAEDAKNNITYSESALNAITYDVNETIEMVLKDISLMMTVGCSGFPMYYPEDKDGNGKYDDIYSDNVGPHALVVVGKADEPGKVIVSSWGEEFIINIEDINDFCVYDFSEFNGVESSIPNS